MLAFDAANFATGLTQDTAASLQEQGYGLGIIQSLDSGRFPSSRTRAQLQACAAAGLATDVYVYPYFGDGPGDAQRRLSEVDGLEGLVGRLWLDLEDIDPSAIGWSADRRIAMVQAWLNDLDAWSAEHGKPPAGIYTSEWWWTPYMGRTAQFADRPLWAAYYPGDPNYVPTVNDFAPFGGWGAVAIHQYAGDAYVSGVSAIDLNILSEDEAARVSGAPVATSDAPSEPVADLALDPEWVAKKPLIVSSFGLIGGDYVTALRQARKPGEVHRIADAIEQVSRQALA